MQLVSKISNLCDPDPPTAQTDGQTDGRHAISLPRYALLHRAVIKVVEVYEFLFSGWFYNVMLFGGGCILANVIN